MAVWYFTNGTKHSRNSSSDTIDVKLACNTDEAANYVALRLSHGVPVTNVDLFDWGCKLLDNYTVPASLVKTNFVGGSKGPHGNYLTIASTRNRSTAFYFLVEDDGK